MGRILIVEDHRVLAEMLAEALTERGHEVQMASDGMDGLHRVTQERHDVAVVDLRLPKLSGAEVIRRMRQERVELRILAISGLAGPVEMAEVVEAGADGALAKPFGNDEFIAAVEKLLQERGSAGVR